MTPAVPIFALLAITVTPYACSGVTPEVMKQRQEVVDLCIARGGIPILTPEGDNIAACDFPPQVGAPKVEK